ncbi:hypothetical protein PLESTF_001106300 [Pleodorina starrii]|nr:hypothetical protein PLESTF_001106300 [Pleodorina starrii]
MESWHQQMPRPFAAGGNGSACQRVEIFGRCHHGGAAVSAAPPRCTSTDDSRSCRPSPLGSNEPTPAITFTPAAAAMALGESSDVRAPCAGGGSTGPGGAGRRRLLGALSLSLSLAAGSRLCHGLW